MKQINIRESLVKMDIATNGRYDLTTMYESVRLSEADKKELVQYIDAYDIDATNNFLGNKSGVMGEAVADDISDEELAECRSALTEEDEHLQEDGDEYTQKSGWWSVKFDNTLEGEDVRFDDLSETTQEHIADSILDGYLQGEIAEWNDMTETTEYGWWSVKFDISLEDDDHVRFDDLSEVSQEHIAQSILDGYTSGELFEDTMDESLRENETLTETADGADELDLICNNTEYIYNEIQSIISGVVEKSKEEPPTGIFKYDSPRKIATSRVRKYLFQVAKDEGLHTTQTERETLAAEYVDEYFYSNDIEEGLTESDNRDGIDIATLTSEYDIDDDDYNDGEVKSGGHFFADGEDWHWVKRVGESVHLDFDDWAVWMAFTPVDPDNVGGPNKVAFFIVDEPTGFIDWGPCDTVEEAQEFLDSKVNDWEMDESLKEGANADCIDLEELISGYELDADAVDTVSFWVDNVCACGTPKALANMFKQFKAKRDDIPFEACYAIEDAFSLRAQDLEAMNEGMEELEEGIWDDIKKVGKAVGNEIKNSKVYQNTVGKVMNSQPVQNIKAAVKDTDTYKKHNEKNVVAQFKAKLQAAKNIEDIVDIENEFKQAKANKQLITHTDVQSIAGMISRRKAKLGTKKSSGTYSTTTTDARTGEKRTVTKNASVDIQNAIRTARNQNMLNDCAKRLTQAVNDGKITNPKIIKFLKKSMADRAKQIAQADATNNAYGRSKTGDKTIGRVKKEGLTESYHKSLIEMFEMINEAFDAQKIATDSKGNYLVKADSGKGYSVFSRDNVALGGYEADTNDENKKKEIVNKFNKGIYEAVLNEGPGAGYTIRSSGYNIDQINSLKINSISTTGYESYKIGFYLNGTGTVDKFSATAYYSETGEVEDLDIVVDGDFELDITIDELQLEGVLGDDFSGDLTAEIIDREAFAEMICYELARSYNSYVYGGGYSHRKFNGSLMEEDGSHAGWFDNCALDLTTTAIRLASADDIERVDFMTDGFGNKEEFTVFADDSPVDYFETEDEAIAYAQENGCEKVVQTFTYYNWDGEPIDFEEGDIVWEADEFDESLQERNLTRAERHNRNMDRIFDNKKQTDKRMMKFLKDNSDMTDEEIQKAYDDDKLGLVIKELGLHDKFWSTNESLQEGADNMSKKLTEGFDTEEKIAALAEYLGIDPEEIEEYSYGYGNEFETPEGDYLVVDEEEAYEAAKDDIENLFDDIGLDSFTSSFRDWIIMNALDSDWFADAVRESYDSYVEDIEYENSQAGFDNRLIEELYDEDIITDDDFEQYDDGSPNYAVLADFVDLDDKKEEYLDLLVYRAGDPVDYCGDNFGWDWVTEMANVHGLIDMQAVVDECIDQDGVAHFIARYDGEEIDLGNGLFAYRTN